MKFFRIILFSVIFSSTVFSQNTSFIVADSLNNLGDKNYWNEKYSRALVFYKSALIFSQKSDSVRKTVDILNNIGIVLDYQGAYAQSSAYLHQALDLAKAKNYRKGIANSLNNLGSLAFNYKNYDKALEYFEESLKIEKENKDALGIASSLENIGVVYKSMKNYDKALENYYIAENIYKSKSAKSYLANLYDNLGNVFLELKQFDDALNYFQESKEISESLNNRFTLCISFNNIGTAHVKQGKFPLAIENFEKGLDLALEMHLTEQILYANQQLFKAYEKEQNYDKALMFTQKYHHVKDSIFTKTKHRQFVDLQTKYETKEKQLKIDQQSELLKKRKNLMTLLILALTLFVMLSLGIFYFYIQKNVAFKRIVERNMKLTEKEKELENFMKFSPEKADEKKYAESNLKENQRKDLVQQIVRSMLNEKVFLDKKLTVHKLAELLNTNRHYISEAINLEFNTNFNNFINEYRIKEARKLLSEHKHKEYSLQGISEMVGFNSRATFNAAFKKFTGVTPSFFYKNIE